MFGWFAPKCPVDLWEKTWTEYRFRWLIEKFGLERLRLTEVILPTEEYFPDLYTGSPDDAARWLVRLCGYMEVDAASVRLEIRPDEEMRNAIGHYEQGEEKIIRVAESVLTEPQRLAAVLAHELSHEVLLGGGRLVGDEEDHELTTDLATVFLGVGLFGANTTVTQQQFRMGNWYWWSMQKQGYLTSRLFGYALALFAWLREEENPPWAAHLRLDAASALKNGLRFLHKTKDALCEPALLQQSLAPTPTLMVDRLRRGTPTLQLATLWELKWQPLNDPAVIDAIVDRLGDRAEFIPGAAADALVANGSDGTAAVPLLCQILDSACAADRASAAQALGVFRQQPDRAVAGLTCRLDDSEEHVVAAAAIALGTYGREAEPALRRLLATLEEALINCRYPVIDAIAHALLGIVPDPKKILSDYFPNDRELRKRALQALRQHQRGNTLATE
jgi:hypothetical protein